MAYQHGAVSLGRRYISSGASLLWHRCRDDLFAGYQLCFSERQSGGGFEAAGAIIGPRVDGSASNDGSSLMFETRQALYLQRLRYGAKQVTPQKVLHWATQGSAQLLGRSDLGEIRPGKQADLALYRLDELRFSGSHDPLAALILCGAERADSVMVGGEWRVTEGETNGLDTQQLIARHRQAAKQWVATF